MILLKELINAAGNVTLLELDLRQPDGTLIKQIHIGEGQNEEAASLHQREMIRRGQLEMIDKRINHHGERKHNGFTETAFWPKLDGIPKDLLDAQVTSFHMMQRRGWEARDGDMLHAHICRIQQQLTDLL